MEDGSERVAGVEQVQPYVPSGEGEGEAGDRLMARIGPQVEGLFPLLLVAYPLAILALGLLVALSVAGEIPMRQLTADPSELMGDPIYTGLLSKVCIILWCATATVCLVGWAGTPRRSDNNGMRTFLLVSGLFSAWLLVDDFFTIHDILLPNHFGISEEFYPPAYVVLNVLYLAAFRRVILSTQFVPLLLAYVFFALSILIDVTNASPIDNLIEDGQWLAEDGLKFLGIVSWLVYFVGVALGSIRVKRKT